MWRDRERKLCGCKATEVFWFAFIVAAKLTNTGIGELIVHCSAVHGGRELGGSLVSITDKTWPTP